MSSVVSVFSYAVDEPLVALPLCLIMVILSQAPYYYKHRFLPRRFHVALRYFLDLLQIIPVSAVHVHVSPFLHNIISLDNIL